MDTQALAQTLNLTVDPRQSKQAEVTLRQQEATAGFSLALLTIVASDSFPQTTRLAGALYFKNFILRNWTDEDGNYKLQENEVVTIKQQLIGLMISVPGPIQSQLGEAVSAIADSDFWQRWDTLVSDLASRLTPDNFAVNNGVLQVAHSIFKRWRPLFKSDELYTEINHVLSKFDVAFLTLVQNTDQIIEANRDNKDVLQPAFANLNLIVKLFFDLSCQDLPPLFESNIESVTGLLHKYLTYDNPLLHTDDESESGPLEFLRAGIFEVFTLWVQKYDEDFGRLLPNLISSSWTLLTTISTDTKYDILVSKALQFLTSVTKLKTHAEAFNNEANLGEVVEKVVLPNLTLRESDEELFEDEPIEFIRRDLEGSDSETRRRAATDFLRQLMEQFESLVTNVVSKYINHYLQSYASDPKENWKAKDTASYLFTSIAAKGAITAAQGVRTVNPSVNVLDFFQKNVAGDLTSADVHPLLKVDALKFLYVFRSQLTQEYWHQAFPLVVNHLGSSNYVVYTYASIAVERSLLLTNEANQPLIPRAEVAGLAKELLQHLFGLIQKDSAPEKIQENEFLMRCVMRVLIVIKDGVLPIADVVLTNFINITKVIRHNPSNPRFYYYHFEGIGALVRYAAPSNPSKFDAALYEPFSAILGEGVQEFMPYVFQLFAALLEANPSGALPEGYRNILNGILLPDLWQSKGNVPALVRLLVSIAQRDSGNIASSNQIEPILGIYQKLISSKANEAHAFDLIEGLIVAFPAAALTKYFQDIVQLMLARLSGSKTETLTQRFIRFYHLVSASDDKGYGTDFFIQVTDQIQHDIYKQVYLSIILPDSQKLSRTLDRKTAAISFAKILTDSQAFVDRYPKGWSLTCEALLKLLINPPVPAGADDLIMEQDVDDLSFGVGFTQLNTCKKAAVDPFPDVVDVKSWTGQKLKEADGRHGGRITKFVQERLSDAARQTLVSYMQG